MDIIETISERIARHRGQNVNETDTKATLITPLITALGWPHDDLDFVKREYRHNPKHNPVDYALIDAGQPRVFIEAKALDISLNNHKWLNQIAGYASVSGVKWIVLTNGDEYRIYNAGANVPVEEKLFRSIRISDGGSYVETTLGLLSHASLQDGRLDAHWRHQFIDRRITQILYTLFRDGNKSIIRLVRLRDNSIQPKDIAASLQRVRIRAIEVPEGVDKALLSNDVVTSEKPDIVKLPRPHPRNHQAFVNGYHLWTSQPDISVKALADTINRPYGTVTVWIKQFRRIKDQNLTPDQYAKTLGKTIMTVIPNAG